MTLLIRFNATGTHADVSPGGEGTAGGAYRLQPGESYYAIPYDTWASHAGQTVDVLSLQYRTLYEGGAVRGAQPSPAEGEQDAESIPTGPVRSLPKSILIDGMLMFGLPYVVLVTVIREYFRPGRVGWEPEIVMPMLGVRVALVVLLLAPLVGWRAWRQRTRHLRGK